MSLAFARSALLALSLAVSAPALADAAAIEKGLAVMDEARTEETYYRAAQSLIDMGPSIIPDLTDRLIGTDDEDDRIELTFLLASVLAVVEFNDETADIPPDLVAETAALLDAPASLALEGNLANLAARFSPQPPEITEGLLSLLSRAENEGLRATTSAVIAIHGDPSVLPLVHEALRQSDSDRLSGDLATILRGTDLPDDVAEILQDVLSSDDPEARQSASRALSEAGVQNPAQLDAALRDLDEATTDMELLNAAYAVREHNDGSVEVADALANALERAGRVEERIELVRTLAVTGEAGLTQLYSILAATEDAEIFHHLVLGANGTSEVRDDPRMFETLWAIATEGEDPDIADAAAIGLVPHQSLARPAIEEALAAPDTPPAVTERLEPLLDMMTG